MSEEEIQEAIKYNLDYLEGNISIENELEEAQKEIKRLNNIIINMEEELMIIYLDIMEYTEDYAKKEIKKLKGVDKE